ncbi:MATE family efflux transporter [Paenibacillus filicis]|uniref:MATE family efflux transporter n=1 Tax=Paenibacillus filicis TaxID=669464 RepID=A0ABU9DBQ8_9BACL
MNDLLTERTPAWKKLSLFAVTWPIFVDSLLRMMLGTADVFMLSRISDQVAGAIGFANEMIVFCIMMFGFVGIGTSVAVTQYLGAGRRETATRIAAIAITMNLIFGLLVSLALVLLSRPLLTMMHIEPSMIDSADRYLKLIGGFIWIEALSYALSSVIRANGQTRGVMFVTLGVNIVHVVGNYLLIFGHLGFPEWGVTGAAVSAVISRFLGLIVLVVLLYKTLPVRIRLRDYVTFDKLHVRQILGIGLPSAGEHLSWQSQHMMVMVFITMIGPAALSAHVYVYNISAYFMALSAAIGMGTEIVIGHMIGAGELKTAYRRLIRSVQISLTLTFSIVCIAALFRESLMGLFTQNPEIIAMGTSILLLSVLLEPGRTFNLVVINSLRAAGDARFPVLMGVLSMWGICVPLAYWLGIHMGMGLLGIWIAFATDEWLRGLIMMLRWRSRAWERKALVKPAATAEGSQTVTA